jgi:hypothetical protein
VFEMPLSPEQFLTGAASLDPILIGCLSDFAASGLSVADFCQQEKMNGEGCENWRGVVEFCRGNQIG